MELNLSSYIGLLEYHIQFSVIFAQLVSTITAENHFIAELRSLGAGCTVLPFHLGRQN